MSVVFSSEHHYLMIISIVLRIWTKMAKFLTSVKYSSPVDFITLNVTWQMAPHKPTLHTGTNTEVTWALIIPGTCPLVFTQPSSSPFSGLISALWVVVTKLPNWT